MPVKKLGFTLPPYIAILSDKARRQYIDIFHSLDMPGGGLPTDQQVLEYALESLYDIERLVGDPEEYIDTLNETKPDFIELWDATVLNEKNPNAKILTTMGMTGQMVFKWVAARFQFVKREPKVIAEEVEETED